MTHNIWKVFCLQTIFFSFYRRKGNTASKEIAQIFGSEQTDSEFDYSSAESEEDDPEDVIQPLPLQGRRGRGVRTRGGTRQQIPVQSNE